LDTKLNESVFTRKIDNVTLTISDEKILNIENEIRFSFIKSGVRSKKIDSTHNSNIGSFDIETFIDSDGKSKVYALGYSTTIDNNIPKTFYLKDDANTSSELVLLCINAMLQSKYNKFIFYTHNLGGYDVVFILKVLLEYNRKNNDYYKITSTFRDDNILKPEIKAQVSKAVKNTISFVDSLNLLPDSLDSLCKSFNTKVTKGIFPYEFVNSNTLNYIGNTPQRKFFKRGNKPINPCEYFNLIKDNWNLKKEAIYYLERDLISLLSVMSEFNRYIFIPNRDSVEFVATGFTDIVEKIIPFFNKYQIEGLKALDFADFRKVSEIMKVKGHLTDSGLEQIRIIKAGIYLTLPSPHSLEEQEAQLVSTDSYAPTVNITLPSVVKIAFIAL